MGSSLVNPGVASGQSRVSENKEQQERPPVRAPADNSQQEQQEQSGPAGIATTTAPATTSELAKSGARLPSSPVSRTALEQDSRVTLVQSLHSRFAETTITDAKEKLDALQTQRTELAEAFEGQSANAQSPNAQSPNTQSPNEGPLNKEQQQQLDTLDSQIEKQTASLDSLHSSLESSQSQLNDFMAHETEGRRLERMGLVERANRQYALAAESLTESTSTILQAEVEVKRDGLHTHLENFDNERQKLLVDITKLESLSKDHPRRIAGVLEEKQERLAFVDESLENMRATEELLDDHLDTAASLEQRRATVLISVTNADAASTHSQSERMHTEAQANQQSRLQILANADSQFSLVALDQAVENSNSLSEFKLQRREAFASQIELLDEAHDAHRESIKEEINRARTSSNEAIRKTDEMQALYTGGPFNAFAALVTGTHSALSTSVDNELQTANEHNDAAANLITRFKRSLGDRNEFISEQQRAFKLEEQGDLEGAQQLFNSAHGNLNDSLHVINQGNTRRIRQTVTQNWQERNREAQAQLSAAIQSADSWETGLRIARDTTIVVGATVATAGTATPLLAAGYGTMTVAGVSLTAGTLTGTTIGALSSAAEQGEAYRQGLVDGDTAIENFTDQVQRDARTSLEVSATSLIGIGAGNKVLGAMTQNGAKLPTMLHRTVAGMAGGGSAASATSALDTTRSVIARNEAIAAFESSSEFTSLSESQREAALEAHLSEHGLGYDQMLRRGVFNTVGGTLAGGVGVNTGALRDAATTTRAGVGAAILDTGADIGIGLGTTVASNGNLTLGESIQQAVQSSIVGNSMNHIQNRPSAEPGSPTRPRPQSPETPPSSATSPASPRPDGPTPAGPNQAGPNPAAPNPVGPNQAASANIGADSPELLSPSSSNPRFRSEEAQAISDAGGRQVSQSELNQLLFPDARRSRTQEGPTASGVEPGVRHNRLDAINENPIEGISSFHPEDAELAGVGAATPNEPLAMANGLDGSDSRHTIDTTVGRNQDEGTVTVAKDRANGGDGEGDAGSARTSDADQDRSSSPRRTLNDDELVDRIDELQADPNLSHEKIVELLDNARRAGLEADLRATLDEVQLSRIAAVEASIALLPDKTPAAQAQLSDSIRKITSEGDISLTDIKKLFSSKNQNDVTRRLAGAASLIDQGVQVSVKDLRGSPDANQRLERAQKELTAGVSIDRINQRLEARRSIAGKLNDTKLSSEKRYELEVSLERLVQNDAFLDAHRMQDVVKFLDPNNKSSLLQLSERIDVINDIAQLANKNIEGVERLFANIANIDAGTKQGDIRGFLHEADVALKLLEQGHEVLHLSAESFNGQHFPKAGNRNQFTREIDIIARDKDGKLVFIEVKSSIHAFLDKNKGDITKAQISVQSQLAAAHGAENRVIISDTRDLDTKRSNEPHTGRKRIAILITTARNQNLLPNPPQIFEANGNLIR